MDRDGNDPDENGETPASDGRTERGRFANGHRFSQGRPRNAITNALRRLVDPDEIAGFLLAVVRNPLSKTKDRLQAAAIVYERLEGKAPQAIALAVTTAEGGLPADWDELTPAQRIAFLDSLPGVKALPSG